MANPRKFSEKIALHNHRQAEETAAFEQIMKEVIEVTTKVAPERGTSKSTLRLNTPSLGAFKGGSLPNVSAGTPDVKSQPETDAAKEDTPHANRVPSTISYRASEGRSRARSQCGPIRRPHDRKLDTSPYSSAAYLSPPTDTGWRRTNSDSALHQSTMQGMVDRNNDGSNRSWNMPMMNGPDRNLDGRPRSSCDIPTSRVPGISIHPSVHDPSLIQIPIANTGSLPDLTNVDFSSPIHAPLDQDHDSSPYSSSPVNTSPSTLSPTSIPQGVRPLGRFHFTPVSHAHSNHLSVPLNSRYQQQHVRKNVQLDKNVNLVDSDYTQLHGMPGMYQQQCPRTSPSPTLQQTPSYRSPRPSPQSSPSPGGRHSAPCSPGAPSPLPNDYHILNQQTTQFQQHFEQLSMDWAQLVASLMESGCTWSAQLQMSLQEQSSTLEMLDNPPNTMSYVDQNSAGQGAPMQGRLNDGSSMGVQSSCNNVELASDPGYYSTSPSQQQLVYPNPSPGGMHTTPNTPTSLPEIILTDFSGEDMLRQDSLSRQLASEFFSDETLKEGLGSLDFDEFQILSNPSMSIPETVEDNFRLDHRS